MQGTELITALELPAATMVNKRIPKTLLTEHGAATAADKRRIKDGIERIQWVAVLKPDNIGVAVYADSRREYLEIAVLQIKFRPVAKTSRLIELLHRAVPYPALVVAEYDDDGTQQQDTEQTAYLSVAHKRWSQGEAGKTVLDGGLVTVQCPAAGDSFATPFVPALALSRQPTATMYALYQGWLDTLLALEVARRTGNFQTLHEPERRAERAKALHEADQLDTQIKRLRASAKKEKQVARQVELNLKIQKLQEQLQQTIARF